MSTPNGVKNEIIEAMAATIVAVIPHLRGLDKELDPGGTVCRLLQKIAAGGAQPSGILMTTTRELQSFTKTLKTPTRVVPGPSTRKAKRVSFEDEGAYKVPLYETFRPAAESESESEAGVPTPSTVSVEEIGDAEICQFLKSLAVLAIGSGLSPQQVVAAK